MSAHTTSPARIFPPEFLDELRARIPLAALIGRRVKLTRSGREHKGLCPFHNEGTPSFTVYSDHFHCFGCGKNGDAIQFVTDCQHIEFKAAVAQLAAEAGLPLPDYINGTTDHANGKGARNPRKAEADDDWVPQVPPSASAPQPSKSNLRCDKLHTYRDATGAVLFYVRRFEARNGARKTFLPLTYGTMGGHLEWHGKAPDAPRALYGLDRLAARPEAPVMVCEGEKSADAAGQLFPDHVCVTWQGGSKAVDKADWQPLTRRQTGMIIWPDNDAGGYEAAAKLKARFPGARVLRVDDLAEGHDAADVQPDNPEIWLRERLPKPDGVAPGLLEVLTPSQISQEQARPYVVKGLIARGDHIITMGHPGSGKSVIAPHVAYAVAQGHEVFGRRVKAGPVIYFASEDGHGMKNRVRALLKRYGDAPNFHLVPVPLDLMNDGPSRNAVMDLVEKLRPALIVIDTLSRSFPGLRENESEDMGRVVQVVREMTAICGSAVWSIHHVAKDGGRTPRGHGSLEADADMTMLISGDGAKTRTITLGKNRNGSSDITLAFNIDVDELGLDEDGDPITAPISVEADPQTLRPSSETKLADKPALLLRVLSNMDPAVFEDIRPDPAMPVCKAVRRSNLRKALIAQSWFPENVVCDEGLSGLKLLKPGYVMENNGLTPLKRKGFINFNREWIWLI